MTNFTGNMSPTILFYKLIQCVHHLSLMKMQQDGKVSIAFTLKLGHLNDFIKPANSTEKIPYNVDQMNKAWVSRMTMILIYHYESSVADLVGKISFLRMDPFQVQHFINKTLKSV
jgi:hypothetical protein